MCSRWKSRPALSENNVKTGSRSFIAFQALPSFVPPFFFEIKNIWVFYTFSERTLYSLTEIWRNLYSVTEILWCFILKLYIVVAMYSKIPLAALTDVTSVWSDSCDSSDKQIWTERSCNLGLVKMVYSVEQSVSIFQYYLRNWSI